jgi:predicted Zn-dependent protease
MSACTAPAAGSTIDSHEEPLEAAHRLIEKEETTMRELQEAVVILNREKDQFPDDVRIYVYLARAYYRIGGREENIDLEYLAYDQAGKYAKKALELDAGRAEAHYWHGLFLLKKAEKIGGLGALFIVREGIREVEVVRATMAEYDHGGASRVLGLLSCQAPSWTPFGDINRCVQLAEESVRIAPDHPLNRLYLADAYRQRGDREAAIREYREILSRASGWSESQRREFRQEALAGLTSLGEPVNGAKAASND